LISKTRQSPVGKWASVVESTGVRRRQGECTVVIFSISVVSPSSAFVAYRKAKVCHVENSPPLSGRVNE
jgi:hypothetical protein